MNDRAVAASPHSSSNHLMEPPLFKLSAWEKFAASSLDVPDPRDTWLYAFSTRSKSKNDVVKVASPRPVLAVRSILEDNLKILTCKWRSASYALWLGSCLAFSYSIWVR